MARRHAAGSPAAGPGAGMPVYTSPSEYTPGRPAETRPASHGGWPGTAGSGEGPAARPPARGASGPTGNREPCLNRDSTGNLPVPRHVTLRLGSERVSGSATVTACHSWTSSQKRPPATSGPPAALGLVTVRVIRRT